LHPRISLEKPKEMIGKMEGRGAAFAGYFHYVSYLRFKAVFEEFLRP